MVWFVVYIASIITALINVSNAEEGIASHYDRTSGSRVACGGALNEGGMTAAHRTLPCGTKVRVTNKKKRQERHGHDQ
jgi:rare lipoprotein A